MNYSWLFASCLLSLLVTSSLSAEGDSAIATQTVRPELSTAPLLNPGKGWVLYYMPGEHPESNLAYGAVGYQRFNWCEIEPQEDQYNFKPIDKFVEAWTKKGLPVALGVMTANIHHLVKYVTPKWVFDAGCKPREVQEKTSTPGINDDSAEDRYRGIQVIPDNWIDPVFLEKLEDLLKAIADRYVGKANMVWYEIRSYGNWGEGHLWPWHGKAPSPDEVFEHHIMLHRRIFKDIPLMAAETYFCREPARRIKAAKIGVGVRDDGIISYRDGSTTTESDGLVPSCFEWGGSYAQFKEQGNISKLEDCIRNGHVYYCGLARNGTEGHTFLQNEKALVDRLTNLMGYHLIITQATLPKTITAGQSFPLNITWRNEGVARIWFPYKVALALLDDRAKVISHTWLSDSNPGALSGGQSMTETLKATFDPVPVGSYRLAVGLFRDRLAAKPDIKLGLKDITADNWHPLATVIHAADQSR